MFIFIYLFVYFLNSFLFIIFFYYSFIHLRIYYIIYLKINLTHFNLQIYLCLKCKYVYEKEKNTCCLLTGILRWKRLCLM